MKFIINTWSLTLIFTIKLVTCQVNNDCLKTMQVQTASSNQTECPPWFFYNATTKRCECYSSPSTDNIVKCTKQGALLRFGYCMTHTEEEGFFVSLCEYFKLSSFENVTKEDNYIVLPNNTSELNDFMCGPLNRKGRLCSECRDGFGPSVTSIGHTCSNCTDVWYGLPLYLFLEFVPITVFYVIVLCFKVHITSAPMVAFVFYCQIIVSTFLIISNRYLFDTTYTYKFMKILITFYGIWNLDFFRYIVPPFCVSQHIKPIQINFLYYISAFYPLILIAVSWIFIRLHSRDCKPIVWLWSKFDGYILQKLNVKRDANNTLIDVFATFFLLSYAKLVFTCFRTISFKITYNAQNFSNHQILHVKSDPNMGYFSTEHLPYAITSFIIFVLIIIPLPLLLALYPIRTFRSLLFKCPIGTRTMATLHIFLEKFYSFYRDGLDGGRDMRSFVCVHFLLRVIGNYLSVDELLVNLSFITVILLYLVSSLLIALVQPYKKPYMNITDTLIMANLTILSLILDKYSRQRYDNSAYSTFLEVCGSVLSTVPLLALTGVIVIRIFRKIKRKFCNYQKAYNNNVEKETETLKQVLVCGERDPELPDRSMHPHHYVGEVSSGGSRSANERSYHNVNDC